jgi:hypothetical protein
MGHTRLRLVWKADLKVALQTAVHQNGTGHVFSHLLEYCVNSRHLLGVGMR